MSCLITLHPLPLAVVSLAIPRLCVIKSHRDRMSSLAVTKGLFALPKDAVK